MHGKRMASGVELVAKKAANNKGRGMGRGPGHLPEKVGLDKSKLLGRLMGREAADEEYGIMGDMAYHDREGGPPRRERGLPLK